MTETELIDALIPFNYQVVKQPQQHHYALYDDHGQIMATINMTKRSHYQIMHRVNKALLNQVIIHFANTPLEFRTTHHQVPIKLSQSEIDALYQMPTGKNRTHVQLSNLQLHALRHLQKQVNHFRNQVPKLSN